MDRGSDKNTQGLLPGPMVWVVTAALGYTLLAVYLFEPYWGQWEGWQVLWPVNMAVGAMGVYLLGRRWISSRPASLLSGALYGFCPLAIYMTRFHPVAGFLAAMVPWLFCPVAYVPRWMGGVDRQFLGRAVGWWVQGPLLAAPFLVILGIFAVLEHYRLFPIPLYKGTLYAEDWMGWVAPWVAAQQGRMPSGLYHVPLAALTFALVMVVKAKRWPILLVIAAALVLANFSPVLKVPPMTWPCVALTWMAVLVGLGLDGLVWAGWADRGWLVVVLVVVSGLGLGALAWASYAGYHGAPKTMGAMIHTFRMFGLAAASVGLVLAIVLVRVRLLPFRQVAIFVAVGLDLAITARLLVDALL